MISAVVGALITIALGVGMTHYANKVERDAQSKSVKEQVDPTYLASILDGMYSSAATMGSKVISKLNDKLSNISTGNLYANPTVRKYINRAKSEVNDKLNEVQNDLAEIARKQDKAENSVNSYNLFSNDFKTSKEGKKIGEEVKKHAEDARDASSDFVNKYKDFNVENIVR